MRYFCGFMLEDELVFTSKDAPQTGSVQSLLIKNQSIAYKLFVVDNLITAL